MVLSTCLLWSPEGLNERCEGCSCRHGQLRYNTGTCPSTALSLHAPRLTGGPAFKTHRHHQHVDAQVKLAAYGKELISVKDTNWLSDSRLGFRPYQEMVRQTGICQFKVPSTATQGTGRWLGGVVLGQSWRLSGQGRSYERWRLIDRYIDRCRPSPGWVRPSGWTLTQMDKGCEPRGGERKESEAGGRVQAMCRRGQ